MSLPISGEQIVNGDGQRTLMINPYAAGSKIELASPEATIHSPETVGHIALQGAQAPEEA